MMPIVACAFIISRSSFRCLAFRAYALVCVLTLFADIRKYQKYQEYRKYQTYDAYWSLDYCNLDSVLHLNLRPLVQLISAELTGSKALQKAGTSPLAT
jgi:hypothetical protein